MITARYCATSGKSSRLKGESGKRYSSAQCAATSRREPSSASARLAPKIGVQRPLLIASISAGNFSKLRRSPPNPGTYQMRPLFNRRNSTGIHASALSRTAARAADIARSICPSRCDFFEKDRHELRDRLHRDIALHCNHCRHTCCCQTRTQCCRRAVVAGRHVPTLTRCEHDKPARFAIPRSARRGLRHSLHWQALARLANTSAARLRPPRRAPQDTKYPHRHAACHSKHSMWRVRSRRVSSPRYCPVRSLLVPTPPPRPQPRANSRQDWKDLQ